MSTTLDPDDQTPAKQILMVAANPAVSPRTGWPIGFWWSELTHPFWVFEGHGYQVTVSSPDGGDLEADAWSDPRDDSGYSANDLITLGFVHSVEHVARVADTPPIDALALDDFDAVFLVGGQSPMVTMAHDQRVRDLLVRFYESGKIVAVVCHATCTLLETRLSDGRLLVEGKTWTGFANSEEQAADDFVGQALQPFRIEDEARKIEGTNFIVHGPFRPHAVRDGRLITGQQQHSGAAVARLVIEALGA